MFRSAAFVVIGAIVLKGAESSCDAAVVYAKAPDGARQIASENAAKLLKAHPSSLGGFRMEELTISEPIPNFYVGPADLEAGGFLASARPGGWTYLFTHGTAAAGAAGVIGDPKNPTALRFNGLYETNFTSETLEALRRANQLSAVRASDYEVRRLDCPPIHYVAVWLHRNGDDIIMPLPPTFNRWNAYQAYSEDQMLKLLSAEAKRVQPGMIGR